jgi:hypothetical protein
MLAIILVFRLYSERRSLVVERVTQNDIRDESDPLPLLHSSDECFSAHVLIRLSLPRSVTVVGPRLDDSKKGQGERRGCQYNAAYGRLSQDHSTAWSLRWRR